MTGKQTQLLTSTPFAPVCSCTDYLAHAGVVSLNADAVQDLLDVTCAGALFASEGSEQVSSDVTHPTSGKEKPMGPTCRKHWQFTEIFTAECPSDTSKKYC